MDSTQADLIGFSVMLALMVLMWLTPTIIAISRQHRIGSVFALSCMAPFTASISWFVALAQACSRKPRPVPPTVVVQQVPVYLPEPQPELVPAGPPAPTTQPHDPWQFLEWAKHNNN